MSPSRPTVRPSIRPLARRIVMRSSRPCVGCSWAPSPALMIERLDVLGQQVGGARRRVADDHDVGPHRLDVLGRVDERLALGEARDAGGEVLGVGREPLGGQAEAGPGPGRVLEEQVEDDPPLERGDLLAAPGRDLGERLGRVEDRQDLLGREVLEAEQVLAGPGGWRAAAASCRAGLGGGDAMVTARASSRAGERREPASDARRSRRPGRAGRSRTRTRSLAVGRQVAGRRRRAGSGSSRWPRSTSTARRIRAGRPRSQIAFSAARIGPAGEEDVVDQDDLGPVDVEGDLGPAQHGPAPAFAQVVAVERDIHGADRAPRRREQSGSSAASRSASGTPRVRTPTRRSGRRRRGGPSADLARPSPRSGPRSRSARRRPSLRRSHRINVSGRGPTVANGPPRNCSRRPHARFKRARSARGDRSGSASARRSAVASGEPSIDGPTRNRLPLRRRRAPTISAIHPRRRRSVPPR